MVRESLEESRSTQLTFANIDLEKSELSRFCKRSAELYQSKIKKAEAREREREERKGEFFFLELELMMGVVENKCSDGGCNGRQARFQVSTFHLFFSLFLSLSLWAPTSLLSLPHF